MPQVFRRRSNALIRLTLILIVGALALSGYALGLFFWSPYATGEDMARQQPVPFSHEHHVGGLGIDCRYCHTSVEVSSYAGMPGTEICMNCHSFIYKDEPMLAPVRASWDERRPIEWNKVHDLPDFVYFNHSIHVHKGVGCETCHGRVDKMPLTWKAHTFYMKWCLDCHQNPAPHLRPRDAVFEMGWQPSEDRLEMGKRLVKEYRVRSEITECYTCHR